MVYSSVKAKMLEAFRFRMYFFAGTVSVIFLILLGQLINLQVIQGEEYKYKAKLNKENHIPIPATRGDMFDRNFVYNGNNRVIVSNRPSFNLTTIPAKFKSTEKLIEILSTLSLFIDIDIQEVRKELKDRNPWERLIIKEDVSFDTIVKVASHQDKFPFIDWEDAPVRVYNHNNMFAHVTGYIGSISKKEYGNLKSEGYKYYQKIGKFGLEKEYDDMLRGDDGYVIRIVDVRNRTEGEEMGRKPTAGKNLVLTLDYEIQKAAFEAIGDQRGAVIVLKPSTGEVLSLVSKPDFDPNQIIAKENYEIITELTSNEDRPFLNRVIQSKYPPASTFKLVTAISSLETEKAYPSLTYHCPGQYTLKGYRDKVFYCYEVHGSVDMKWAIAKSCSVYFYQLGYKVGPTKILQYADYFGLNKKTHIDLPGEVAGFIPSKKWKRETFGQPWFDGDTINLSIGQGFLNVTPIGLANFLSTIVNNSGKVYKPHLLKEIRSADNSKVEEVILPQKVHELPINPLTLDTVRTGMRMSVTNGTSGRLKYLKVDVAGKTGTAQTRSKRMDKYTQHAWFAGYAPFDGPPEKAAVVVILVEYGIAGAVGAVPIAEKIFQRMYELEYFAEENPDLNLEEN